jgi:hypothetical protein
MYAATPPIQNAHISVANLERFHHFRLFLCNRHSQHAEALKFIHLRTIAEMVLRCTCGTTTAPAPTPTIAGPGSGLEREGFLRDAQPLEPGFLCDAQPLAP